MANCNVRIETTEGLLSKLSTIERMLGKIEGVAFVLEDRYASPLLDAVEVIDAVLEEIKDGNKSL